MLYEIDIDGRTFRVELARDSSGGWICKLDGQEFPLDAVAIGADVISLVRDGKAFDIRREYLGEVLRIWVRGTPYPVEVRDPRSFRGRKRSAGAGDGPRKLTAPMPGKIVRVLVSEGGAVKAGEGIIVIEAMKMQNEITSPKDGVLKKIMAASGTSVNAGDLLAVVE